MKSWQQSETDNLVKHRAAGLSAGQIANLIGRNRDQVLGKTFRLRMAGLIVDTQLGLGFTVLQNYTDPQSLQEIVRRGNLIMQNERIPRRAAFKQAWCDARASAGDRIPDMPRSLASYVMKLGGIKPSRHTKQLPLAYLSHRGLTASEASYIALDAGYTTEGCPHELISMLEDESADVRHYSEHDIDIILLIQEYEDAEQSSA